MPVAYGYIEPHDLSLPRLPDRLVGTRIAHITDVHAWRATNRWTRLGQQLSGMRLDLVLFTGDYGLDLKHEDHAFAALKQITDQINPRLGCFGVFGNHDNAALRSLAESLPITWLRNETLTLEAVPIEFFCLDAYRPSNHDVVELALHREPNDEDVSRLRIFMHHYPDMIMTASDLNCDLMFSGHTHGGQCRLPTGHILTNCSSLPLRLTSGILRHRNLLGCISRGVGTGPLPPRFFCKPHVPVYTLRKGPMPGRYSEGIDNIRPW